MREGMWLLPALILVASSAFGANYRVGIGDDCPGLGACFAPSPLTIEVGDTVTFYNYADSFDTGAHNVVADDGSFRCARGCDGQGGDGTPADRPEWSFSLTFSTPGKVDYHDEVTHVTGEIIVQSAPPFGIGPGITGSWYDPAQSGHGLMIEILPDNRFYASWFAFNPSGTQQAWFTGVGIYSGNTATITDVLQPAGGRWIPNFNPSEVVDKPWGTLTFTFSDCNHGQVVFNSVVGYGMGDMNLTRLTQPAGLSCP